MKNWEEIKNSFVIEPGAQLLYTSSMNTIKPGDVLKVEDVKYHDDGGTITTVVKLKEFKIRPSIDVEFGPFWFGIGWYPGNELKLLSVTLFEISDIKGNSGHANFITFFDLQFLKFEIGFGIDEWLGR